MKVSKTVSIELELLQRVLDENPSFSNAVNEALENWLNFKKETERGNTVHFSRTFSTTIPAQTVWHLMTFDGMVKWVNMLTDIEYLSQNKTGLGTKCKLYASVGGISVTSLAEITEYIEYEKMVIRSMGDFRLFVSANLNVKGSRTDIALTIVIGLSDEYASQEIKNEIQKNLDSAFNLFKQVAIIYP